MGCDIHLFVEKRNKVTGMWEVVKGPNPHIEMFKRIAKRREEDGDLQEARSFFQRAKELETGEKLNKELLLLELQYPILEREQNSYLEQEYQSDKESTYKYESPEVLGWLYDNRDYDVFAILADVRNGRGFAGIKTGEGFVPISEPKDLPIDVSEEVKKESDYWGGDGHSHSYLTLKELLTYDWHGQTTKKEGMVTKISYYEAARDFVDEVIPALKKLVHTSKQDSGFPFLEKLTEEQTEDVRIVFWFDN